MELIFLGVLIGLMVIALSSGFPVAFALPGSAIAAIALAAACGYLFADDPGAYFALDGPVQWLTAGVTNFRSLYWNVERDTLIAIPLFVFMGIMLQRSKIAEDLLVAMARLFGPVPGGLGISVVFVGALLAATTGILGATVIAMGLISLPAMMRNNYSKPLATGTICASGSLGQIIPPSIVLIILADQLANAADQARTMRAAEYKSVTGEFSMPAELGITSASAGDMFMGALVPGMILVGLYMIYILVTAIIKKGSAPPVRYDGEYDRRFAGNVALALVPPLALIFAVLGSIVTGVATVNQAGAIGAVGAIVMGGYRLSAGSKYRYAPLTMSLVAIAAIFLLQQFFNLNIKNVQSDHDRLGVILAAIAVTGLLISVAWSGWRTWKVGDTLSEVMVETAKTTSMVFIILIGAAMLTAAFRAFGGEHLVREFLTGIPGGFWAQFMVVMLVIFLLGFFLDFIEIAVVVVPIVAPILLMDPSANITAVWLGVMIGLNIQTSFLTPPFGFALFYLRGVAPKGIKTTHIYKGAAAFIALQLAGLAIAGTFPPLVNYLPNRTYLTSENSPPPVNPRLQHCIEEKVFADYRLHKEQLLTEIDNFAGRDFSALPPEHRSTLDDSIAGLRRTFSLVSRIEQAESDVSNFTSSYGPLHQSVWRIENRLRLLDKRLQNAEKDHERLQRNPETTSEEVGASNLKIFSIEFEMESIREDIPNDWHTSREQYHLLKQAENAARKDYRLNVDNAYIDLQSVLSMLQQRAELEALAQELSDEALSFDATTPDIPLEAILESERQLAGIEGTGSIRKLLTNSRQALKGDEPDVSGARSLLKLGIEELTKEISWRKSASALIPELTQLEFAIRNNIGLRSQVRLPRPIAKDIAMCLSRHRDVSLAF